MQKNQFMFIVGLVFCAIVALFALTNNNTVAINLFFYKFEGVSQAVVIFISAALGAIIVTLLGLVKHLKLKNEIRKLKKENKELSTQVQDLMEQLKVAEAKNEIETNVIDNEIEENKN